MGHTGIGHGVRAQDEQPRRVELDDLEAERRLDAVRHHHGRLLSHPPTRRSIRTLSRGVVSGAGLTIPPPGVESVSDPNVNDAGDTAVITVFPTTSPQDSETQDLVEQLRNDVVPATLDGEDAQAFIGGQTAAFDDVAQRISERLPLSCWS